METFTSIENRLQVLSKSLKILKKIEADALKVYQTATLNLQRSKSDVRQKEIEIEPLKNSLKDLYSKKLDIITR